MPGARIGELAGSLSPRKVGMFAPSALEEGSDVGLESAVDSSEPELHEAQRRMTASATDLREARFTDDIVPLSARRSRSSWHLF